MIKQKKEKGLAIPTLGTETVEPVTPTQILNEQREELLKIGTAIEGCVRDLTEEEKAQVEALNSTMQSKLDDLLIGAAVAETQIKIAVMSKVLEIMQGAKPVEELK